jgi:hypothetical protein
MKTKRLLSFIILLTILWCSRSFSQTNFSGDIFVGTGQTYTSLTINNTGGLFKALNDGIVVGNINVYITSNLTETGDVGLNEFPSPHTITIRPSAAEVRNISGWKMARGLIYLNGADRVTIDGRFNGQGNYLTINNYYWISSTSIASIQVASFGTGFGVSDVTIRNCNIKNGHKGSGSYGIFVGGINIPNVGDDIANITIIDNVIDDAGHGIGVFGNSTNPAQNVVVSGNLFGSWDNSLQSTGIYLGNISGCTVSNNEINKFTTAASQIGIRLDGSGSSQAVISGNHIHGFKNSSFGSKGIRILTGSTSGNVLVYNNLIYDIGGPGDNSFTYSGNANYGIGIFGNTGSVSLHYNTVNLWGTFNRSLATRSAALYVAPNSVNLDVRNNIFRNTIINNWHSGAKAYAVYVDAASGVFSSIDYNDYHTLPGQGVLGYLSADKTTLAEWQAATGQDANSLNADPQLRTNVLLQPITGSPVLAAATPIPGITTDYEGVTRSATSPSMGAYETGYVIPAVDWCNLQSSAIAFLFEGQAFEVYARVMEDGVTNQPGQGPGIECWIGWSLDDTNPNTWTNWIVADYHADEGTKDEYKAVVEGTLPLGTYYLASRFRITDGVYQYGGRSVDGGGFWDGVYNVSGVVTIQDNQVAFANLASPPSATIMEGDTLEVFGLAEVPFVTSTTTPSAGLQAWIGVSTTNSDPATWTDWFEADFTQPSGNRHEYKALIGPGLLPGTYYYASRFQLCDDDFVYGGYSVTGGGFWDGTANVSGVLSVTPLVLNVPWSQGFTGYYPPGLPAGWVAVDVNEDGNTWYVGNNELVVEYNSNEDMDDWVFSPGVNLTAGVTYHLIFYYRAQSSGFPEKLELKYGTEKSVAGMTSPPLFYNTNITNTWYEEAICEITPTANGLYFFGWHGFSDADMYYLYIADISMIMVDAWTGLSSVYWSDPGNWSSGNVPTASSSLFINSPHHVMVDLPHAICQNLTIKPGAKVSIQPNMGLEVTENFDNQANEAGLLIMGDATGTGSLLHNSYVEGVFQRYIEAGDWNQNDDGWHLLSSPVLMQPIEGSWTPTGVGDDYDFYYWDSEQVMWLNQKDPLNDITHFTSGLSYLVSYQQTKTQLFSGTFRINGIASNMPISGDSWVSLGNPFATALIWNNMHWMLDGYADIAKLWKRSTQSYEDLFPGGIIPATNGFMGFGESVSGTVWIQMTIPEAARTINTTPFYKSGYSQGIFLKVRENERHSEQESVILQHAAAGESFSMKCDSRFLPGFAPLFYSLKNGEPLSTYAVPDIQAGGEILFGFEKNQAESYELILDTEKSEKTGSLWLTDLKTGEVHDLLSEPVYAFQSAAGDEIIRFKLTFGGVGINNSSPNTDRLFAKGNVLQVLPGSRIELIEVYGLTGQILLSASNPGDAIPLGLASGIYLVKARTKEGTFVKKIWVN